MEIPSSRYEGSPILNINKESLDINLIIKELFKVGWYYECDIIVNYIQLDKPICVVKHRPRDVYLRYSKGPGTGTFWDVYGDDFLYPELALVELAKAPSPMYYTEAWVKAKKEKDGY